MDTSEAIHSELEAQASMEASWKSSRIGRRLSISQPLPPIPPTSSDRQRAHAGDQPVDIQAVLHPEAVEEEERASTDILLEQQTIFYLAYGSNMCAQTFRDSRKVTPLSQVNVLVPDLTLTFDLPGIAYIEPCFAGTQYRDPATGLPIYPNDSAARSKLAQSDSRRNKIWRKPLVGVVYEVTMKDYARIIATEGGGSSYIDAVVDCYPFREGFPQTDAVPEFPDTKPFMAHTLLSPSVVGNGHNDKIKFAHQDGHASHIHKRGLTRPMPNYAQPSRRYRNLLITGAKEHNLPTEYQDYLESIEPYRVTTTRQLIGKIAMLFLWIPFLLIFLRLGSKFADEYGKSPPWIAAGQKRIFTVAWWSYDHILKPFFGDGERTMDDHDNSDGDHAAIKLN
ncbi:hypothetical protein FQN57_002957 [Myotisia sp. PD_48]|nr:hypothetical protein FQN57_002957 [Myotisia sp. PD_48]